MNNEKIGFIGLGNMGYPMAKNLEKAGFTLSIYNRTPDKAAGFAATSKVCTDVEELVLESDVIFTMLTNDDAVTAVYNDILQLDISGKLFVDMSTISQQGSMQLALAIQERGGAFIDAPVAGSTAPATEGTLIIMAGGDEKNIARAQRYFAKMGKLTKHVGTNGKGIAAKLAINYFLATIYQGLAETVVFSEQLGISRADMLEIINESASGSGATKVKTPLLLKDQYAPAFALDLMLKDILLARAAGANYPLTETLTDTYQSAHDGGLGEQDVMAIIHHIQSI
jgi:3-hydroxyisobutyrate dehydrogenase